MYRITEEYISVQKKLVIYIAIAMLAVLLLTGIVYFLVTGGLKTIDSTLSSAALGLGIGFAGSAAILLLSLNAMVKNMRAAAIEIDDKGIKRTYKNAVDAIPFGDVTGVRARVWKGKMTAVRIKYRYGARNHKAAIDVTGYERIGEIFDKLKEGVNDDRKTA